MTLRIIYCLLFYCLCFSSCAVAQEDETSKLIQLAVSTTQLKHFNPKTINDSLSTKLYHYFFLKLDPNKNIFTKQDIQKLSKHELLLDDYLLNGSTSSFIEDMAKLYKSRLEKISSVVESILTSPLNMTTTEYIDVDISPTRPKNELELRNRWNRILHSKFNETLYYNSIIEPTGNSKDENTRTAINSLKNSVLKKLGAKKSMSIQSLTELFLNSYLAINDPQSSYLSASQKETWNESFSRSYAGIGIYLENQNGVITITKVVPNGPAWKSKLVKKNDVIIAVRGTDSSWTSTEGLSIQEVLKLIKGPVGSNVEFKIYKEGQISQEVAITREELQMELAHSYLIDQKGDDKPIGYIKLPRFYSGNHSSSYDVQNLLDELNDKSITDLILDLRDNQGGSGREAINIIGFFLKGGPVMRASYRDREDKVFFDPDSSAIFEGNLLVLVNTRSSSASELIAGTLQDYGRAIVVGSEATYGKGTIQRFIPLQSDSTSTFGEIKLTIGLFYTGNRRSAQYKGIRPDVILPDLFSFKKSGSRLHPFSLKEEEGSSLYQVDKWSELDLASIKSKSNERIQASLFFQQQLESRSVSSQIPLNWQKYLEFRMKNEVKEDVSNQNLLRVKPLNQDAINAEFLTEKISKIECDHYILESYNILENLN